MGQTCEKYESTTFNHFFNRISSSRLFDFGLRSNDIKSRYYRKPAQYLAAAMELSAYIESGMEDGAKQLEQCRNVQRSWTPSRWIFEICSLVSQLLVSISLVQSDWY